MRKVQVILGILLMAVGLVILYPVLDKKIETYKIQRQLKEAFKESLTNQEDLLDDDLINNDESSKGGTDEEEDVITEEVQPEEIDFSSVNGYYPIGLMEIPSINLSQMVVDGSEDHILQYFLGRLDSSVEPGENGNFIVAGHRVSDYTDAFVNLYKVEIGNRVMIKTRDKEVVYEINDIFIVDPHQVEVLEETEEATITLITCTVGAKQRLILKGDLVSVKYNN